MAILELEWYIRQQYLVRLCKDHYLELAIQAFPSMTYTNIIFIEKDVSRLQKLEDFSN
jgi:hypothetical protein